MYKKLDEEYYVENSFLAHLHKLGWQIFRQNKDDPEVVKEIKSFNSSGEPILRESVKFRKNFREVILEEELKNSIKRINTWIEEDQITEVVRKITTPQANSPLEANREIHDLLLENTSVFENRKTGEKSPTVRFIDFKNPENNSFLAISQFKVNVPGTEKHIIPDIVLFINGLPLVVVECKSPAIADPMNEAFIQLLRYQSRRGEKEGNEKLFWYNLFMVITTRQEARYGTITSGYEHFVEWKDPYPYCLSDINEDKNIANQQVLIQGMLSQKNLLDILHIFTLFKKITDREVAKIVARYQQFRTVKKIIKRIKEGRTSKEKGGIVWHTQGSGKSLTMMYTVRAMYRDPELSKFKIVFVTDRKNLEEQLRDTSKSLGYTVNLAGSIREYQGLLKTYTPDLVMGMIHKFQEKELEVEFPLLNESPNILIMIDEAHRTQYKYLGANLKKSLPNAIRIAFTGTPIEKTERTFGDYIDKYSIKQSVDDGVTVEIVYEGRTHRGKLTDEEAANKKFEDVFSMLDAEEKNKIMGRYTWKAYLENKNVISDKAKDMIDHYITHVFPNKFKAQVVTVSRVAAIRYKKALEEALKKKIKELKEGYSNIDINLLEKLKIEVVISGSPNDPVKYHPYTDSKKHQDIIKRFTDPFENVEENNNLVKVNHNSGDVGIIVVKDMLITGFDAPVEQVMYLDNVIKEHNLLQAIARVNRVYKNKSCGFVVDYVGVLNHLKEALAIYADEDIEEITKVVINKSKSIDNLRYTHTRINDFFMKNRIDNWRESIDECVNLLIDEEIRSEFITLVKDFNKAMDQVLPDPVALKYAADLKMLNFIKQSARNRYRDDKLSITDASNKIREIVEEYLISQGVNPKIPPLPLLSDEFIKSTKKIKSSKSKSEELEFAIIEHIHKHYEEDPEFYERFSDRLKRLLEKYRENWDILATELEKLREEMKNGREAEEVFGIDPKRGMPFFGLLKREIFGKKAVEELKKEDMDFLIDLTKDIVGIIEREVNSIDFWENTTKQKRLKYEILHNLLLPKLKDKKDMFKRRNEIVQKLIELAYHNYGGKNKVILRHQKWIEKKKKEIQLRDIKFSKKEFVNGEGFLYLGNYYRLWLVENQNTPLNFQNGFYLSKKYLAHAGDIFIDWYKERAYEKISERLRWYAQKRGFKYNKVNITNAQKRWGSCSWKGNLNFSWRLIMAPLPVIDYVIVHELVHLVEKNHSRAFWDKVKMLITDYKKHQEWLKKDGHLLRL